MISRIRKAISRRRACLCKDGARYAQECCDEDSVWTQGIGLDRANVNLEESD